MAELTNEQKRIKTEQIAKIVIAGLVCLAVSPIIFAVVQGLVGLLIAGAIGFTALQLTPVFARLVANYRIKLITDIAKRNPIETMNRIYTDNMLTIRQKDEKIVQFGARLGDYKQKMKDFAIKFPNDVQQFAEVASKMQMVLTRQLQKQKIAKSEAVKFHDEIVRAENIYDMAKAAHGLQELSGDIEKQVFQDIEKRVSFDAVTHSFNTAVMELSIEADTDPDSFTQVKELPESVPDKYPLPQAQVIDAEFVPAKKRMLA